MHPETIPANTQPKNKAVDSLNTRNKTGVNTSTPKKAPINMEKIINFKIWMSWNPEILSNLFIIKGAKIIAGI